MGRSDKSRRLTKRHCSDPRSTNRRKHRGNDRRSDQQHDDGQKATKLTKKATKITKEYATKITKITMRDKEILQDPRVIRL
jgi:hypothetical protein